MIMWSGRRASDPQAKWRRRLFGSLQHKQASLRLVHQGTPYRGLTKSANIVGVPLSFLLYNELRYLVHEWDNKRVVDVALQCHADRPREQQGAMCKDHGWWWWLHGVSNTKDDGKLMMAMTTRCDDDDKNIMLFLFFRDSFTLSRICCSTKWRICSPNTRSFVLKLLSHSGTCVPKRGVQL